MAASDQPDHSTLWQALSVSHPPWLLEMAHQHPDWFFQHWSEPDRMLFAINLSHWNVEHGGGGPFGAAIFDDETGRLVSIGVNRVEHDLDPTAHAEVMAIRMACQQLARFNLAQASSQNRYVLYSSAEPCCLCVGAVLWSGLKKVFYAADRAVVETTGFDEGPETAPEALQQRDVLLAQMAGPQDAYATMATEVLTRYHQSGGLIYNGG